MGTTDAEEKTIKSTQTAFDIVEYIAGAHRPSISEIAAEVGHSRSTVHYHLKTLQRNRYVVRDEEGLRLGLRIARLGNLSLSKHRLTGVVERTADDLAVETGAVAHVGVKEGDKLVWLYRSSPEDVEVEALRTEAGRETYLHCTAYGQAILAHLTNEIVESLVTNARLPAVTERTITEPETLEERLSTIRELGFAYSAAEFLDGMSSVAAPIFDDSESVVGSIGITASENRIGNPYKHTKARRFSDELPGHVQKAARIASDHVSDA